ncbi:MAG: NADH:flavin oxidoreductase [Caulobacteraceae bacterium]|nr:NADH:flavin oxidoreductase [Caulobacteraceae bacterium]
MADLFQPLAFTSGLSMNNRFMLAPLTNQQSHLDGRLSDEEFRWLTLRAKGGFGLTMTCAAHVQRIGQGFPGQLGVFCDDHLPGLTRLASAIKAEESLAFAQLHHAGMRSPEALIGEQPVCPSDEPKTGARALTGDEVEQLTEDFIAAAVRCETAGFDGVELHGAHSYILCEFLSPTINQRTDRWGGSLENRSRIIFDIVDGVRARCRPGFGLGLRLSPERFGLELAEIREVAQAVMRDPRVDFLDMSLWDVAKEPEEERFKGRSLMSYFTELDRGSVRLGVAGKITTGAQAAGVMAAGADMAIIGRGAILHHDFPERIRADPAFEPIALPVSRDYLAGEGLSPAFQEYMKNWPGFVAEEETAPTP